MRRLLASSSILLLLSACDIAFPSTCPSSPAWTAYGIGSGEGLTAGLNHLEYGIRIEITNEGAASADADALRSGDARFEFEASIRTSSRGEVLQVGLARADGSVRVVDSFVYEDVYQKARRVSMEGPFADCGAGVCVRELRAWADVAAPSDGWPVSVHAQLVLDDGKCHDRRSVRVTVLGEPSDAAVAADAGM